jgi:hypothetical protein
LRSRLRAVWPDTFLTAHLNLSSSQLLLHMTLFGRSLDKILNYASSAIMFSPLVIYSDFLNNSEKESRAEPE